MDLWVSALPLLLSLLFSRPLSLGKMRRGDTPLLKQQSTPCLGKSELLFIPSLITIFMKCKWLSLVLLIFLSDMTLTKSRIKGSANKSSNVSEKSQKDKIKRAKYSELGLR